MNNDDAQLISKVEIPQIAYPKELRFELQEINDRIVTSLKKEGTGSIEAGQGIPLGPLPRRLDVMFTFFLWIADTNEILDNLNITLSDFRALAEQCLLFSNHRKRVYLILRTFFYEFFRAKEVFNKFTKELLRLGLLQKGDVSPLRAEFAKAFKAVISVRNQLVHARFGWPERENVDLIIVSAANEFGCSVVKKDYEREFQMREALISLYNKYVPTLTAEAMVLSKTVQNMVDHIMEILQRTVVK
jgi:hypothetical protein